VAEAVGRAGTRVAVGEGVGDGVGVAGTRVGEGVGVVIG
jgi:hypothetical protein